MKEKFAKRILKFFFLIHMQTGVSMGQSFRDHVPTDTWNSWKPSAYINELLCRLVNESWVSYSSLQISDVHLRI